LLALPLTGQWGVAKPQCVDPPNLAVAEGDLTNEVRNLHHRFRHALHLLGETVPVG
jgi:hypothetical protein